MIKINTRISSRLREDVHSELLKHVEEISQQRIEYIKARIARRMKVISASRQILVRSLHDHIKALYLFLASDGGFDVDNLTEHHCLIWGGMSYFIDPVGVIPDHAIGDGYLDDAIMVNAILQKLPKSYRNRVESFLDQKTKVSSGYK